MPQLDSSFWALNFLTIWLLMGLTLIITTSLPLTLTPQPTLLTSNMTPTPQWIWT
uniref:ATP synthase F0 subunit 8 n=1 Tax=Glossobalanus marginatus TaxID=1443200 RepID=A0A3Q8HFW2_9BILA|nr:ATP synthase F0 subunit 8 [Glossobalanus marginatus]AXZ97164.1 ATP synthase F0 subunit 8 [Glossobalanus marginatus]